MESPFLRSFSKDDVLELSDIIHDLHQNIKFLPDGSAHSASLFDTHPFKT
jgi:hypothetical protein